MKQIIVDIAADGSVNIEASGFKGGACAKATKAIEEALGGGVKKRTKKPEFYQQNAGSTQVGT